MLGIEANPLFSNGGLDANWLDKHGIPAITIGAGQAEIHTIKEYVNLGEYEKGCRLGILMAMMPEGVCRNCHAVGPQAGEELSH